MIPLAWRAGAAAVIMAALFAFGYAKGSKSVKAQWARADAVRVQAESTAILARVADNAKLETKQAADNAAITKAFNEQISTVSAALASARRMRVPAFCPRSPAPANPESPGSGNAADPESWLLDGSVDRDIKAMMLQTEEVAATGRACQAFVRANGMAP